MEDKERDGFCSLLMYTMFPSSDYAIQHEIKKMDRDLHVMYSELKNEQETFRELKVTLDKLGNKRIPMDPNGMSRVDAVKSTRSRMITVKNKMDAIKKQIDFYERSKYAMETTKMTTDADARIEQLANRMKRVKGIDSNRVVSNMEDIVEANEQIGKLNDTVNDTMVAGWSCDIDADEAMLDEYLQEYNANDELENDDLDVDVVVESEDELEQEREQAQERVSISPTTATKRQAVAEYF